jgi:membrane protein implicated in regulation of membrane protease activity
MSSMVRLAILTAFCAIMAPSVVVAYVGPGAGLGMIGSLIAVIGAVLVAIVGFLILPIRMLLKRRRARVVDRRQATASEGSTQEG